MILKMAIIGFGKSATRYHLPYLAIRDKIQVKYVCDVNYSPEKEDACRNLGCQFTNEDQLTIGISIQENPED